ncbi:MAG TPA: hypothetical protein VMT37_15600 [Solirubrobacterales bacterium]|nr:hypothetical protein [Solirubrobacterales bacterium]
MGASRAVITAVALTAIAVALALIFGGKDSKTAKAESAASPGQPAVSIVSPRNGARQSAHAVVVKVAIENFELAPRHFGGEPELGQGNLRFSLNRVPDCVDPVKLERALNSPIGNARLKGKSADYPKYAGPNGVLAVELGTQGKYSPATRPEIYYRNLNPGFYRLIVSLAQNNGEALPAHDVTTFQILPRPGHGPKPCPKGKVSSAAAAESAR